MDGRTFAQAVYHERHPFRSRNRSCFLDFPILVKITEAKKLEESESSQINHYLYEMQVQHGDHKWTIVKRFGQFFDLYKAVKLSRFALDSPSNEDNDKSQKVRLKAFIH